MKYVLSFALLLLAAQAATAQTGFKLATVQGSRISPVSSQVFWDTMILRGDGLRAMSKPTLKSKGDFAYVQLKIANKDGAQVTAAFEIDPRTGYTRNFRYVCRGDCGKGRACGFTYDNKGKINGCTCCSLDIERIPSRRLRAADLGL